MGDHAGALERKIAAFSDEHQAVLHWLHGTAPPASTERASGSGDTRRVNTPTRTSARPIYDSTDDVVNCYRRVEPHPEACKSLEDFEASVTCLS